jgi:hypothetical protein
MRVTISQQTANGELLAIEIPLKHPSEWDTKVKPMLDRSFARTVERNLMFVDVLKSSDLYLPELRPSIRKIIQAIASGEPDGLRDLQNYIPEAYLAK